MLMNVQLIYDGSQIIKLCNEIHQYPIADCMNGEKQLKNLATDLIKQKMECLSHSNILNITTKVEACCNYRFTQD